MTILSLSLSPPATRSAIRSPGCRTAAAHIQGLRISKCLYGGPDQVSDCITLAAGLLLAERRVVDEHAAVGVVIDIQIPLGISINVMDPPMLCNMLVPGGRYIRQNDVAVGFPKSQMSKSSLGAPDHSSG